MIQLRTERLVMRPVATADEDAIAALGEDARVMDWLGGALTREQTRAWLAGAIEHWRKNDFGRFFVMREGEFVGLAGLSRTRADEGAPSGIEVAWRLAHDRWGHGYATEAARAAIEDARARLGIRDVLAMTAVSNARSRAVMERLGMIHCPEETFEHAKLPEGHPLRTHVVYRLR